MISKTWMCQVFGTFGSCLQRFYITEKRVSKVEHESSRDMWMIQHLMIGCSQHGCGTLHRNQATKLICCARHTKIYAQPLLLEQMRRACGPPTRQPGRTTICFPPHKDDGTDER